MRWPPPCAAKLASSSRVGGPPKSRPRAVSARPRAFPLKSRSLADALPVAVSLTPVIDCPPTSARASCANPEMIFAPQRSASLKSTLRPSSRFASMVIRSLFAATESNCFPSAVEAFALASRAPVSFVRTSGDRSSRLVALKLKSPVASASAPTARAPASRAEARLSPRLSMAQPPSSCLATCAEPWRG